MYIEKHFAIESPHDLAEALEGTYCDTDPFTVLYTQEPPQEAGRAQESRADLRSCCPIPSGSCPL